ncbi:MAG TPA: DNA-binding response regulator [Ruminiclostridium sp.]
MEAFYVSIIFLGGLLVIGSLLFIVMDRVSGKDFFKEFDRKKDEMFGLIQDSEEMIQELNRMSDYVVTVIAEKNQEFFNKSTNININETAIDKEDSVQLSKEMKNQVQETLNIPISEKVNQSEISELEAQRLVNMQFSYNSERYNKDLSNDGKSRLVLNSKRREALQMIEQGLSNDEISDKLKIGKGEIGLIRGLSK